ncbi:hypothetical protein RFI_01760, partial [Reticulomyxa filosa]
IVLTFIYKQEFNSFQIILNESGTAHKEPFNPYSMTLKQGLEHLKHQLQIRQESLYGEDEFIKLECNFDKFKPQILLNDIYRNFPHYPNIQVYWEVHCISMVSYKHTICIERTDIPKSSPSKDISSNQKPKFNPLLYECDIHRLKTIQDTMFSIKDTSNNQWKSLLHEVVKNGFLNNLIAPQYTNNKKEQEQLHETINQQINYNEKNANELILNENILTILNEVKELYHDDIHKQMGYPLQLIHICAILLYCGKSCNFEFSYDQIQFQHSKWKYLDWHLQQAILILHNHERREEESIELYCGLKKVRLENIKEIKEWFFISHVSTSDDIQVAKMFRSDRGCILHFHPSMRRANMIYSCDVSWISPFKNEREILFSRSHVIQFYNTNTKEEAGWNARIEKEDKNTQMILLTWTRYDQFIQQTMSISKMWSHSIDLNLIYIVLASVQGNIELTMECLSLIEEWRNETKNKMKYEEKKKEFMERRCCNHHINLFSIFLVEKGLPGYNTSIEFAAIMTVKDGLPFVEKDKERYEQ